MKFFTQAAIALIILLSSNQAKAENFYLRVPLSIFQLEKICLSNDSIRLNEMECYDVDANSKTFYVTTHFQQNINVSLVYSDGNHDHAVLTKKDIYLYSYKPQFLAVELYDARWWFGLDDQSPSKVLQQMRNRRR